MEKQNLDFEVARHFLNEIKYYTIQNYWKKIIGMLGFVILDIGLALNRFCL